MTWSAPLIAAEESGDRLDHDEVLSILVLLLIAGHETTANLVGSGILAMCRRPEALARWAGREPCALEADGPGRHHLGGSANVTPPTTPS